MFPPAVAVRVVIPAVPPIFKRPVVPWIKVPVPERAVEAFIVPLLVMTAGLVTVSNVPAVKVPEVVYAALVPEKVTVGIELVVDPPIVLVTPVKV